MYFMRFNLFLGDFVNRMGEREIGPVTGRADIDANRKFVKLSRDYNYLLKQHPNTLDVTVNFCLAVAKFGNMNSIL